MSLTGRLSAALLIAACLTVPAGAQTGDDYDDLTLDAPIEIPDSNDWGEVTHHPETDLETLEQAHRDYLRKSTLQLERPEADPVEFDPPSPPPNWLRGLFEFLSHLGPLLTLIFYVAIAALILGVLYFLFGEALRIRFGKDGSKADKVGDDVIGLPPGRIRRPLPTGRGRCACPRRKIRGGRALTLVPVNRGHSDAHRDRRASLTHGT